MRELRCAAHLRAGGQRAGSRRCDNPAPWNGALYAHKRNQALLGNCGFLEGAGAAAEAETVDCLARCVPPTEVMTEPSRDAVWQRGRKMFFRPAGDFGGRARYYGDKLTH